jgi:hypothetical protein
MDTFFLTQHGYFFEHTFLGNVCIFFFYLFNFDIDNDNKKFENTNKIVKQPHLWHTMSFAINLKNQEKNLSHVGG